MWDSTAYGYLLVMAAILVAGAALSWWVELRSKRGAGRRSLR